MKGHPVRNFLGAVVLAAAIASPAFAQTTVGTTPALSTTSGVAVAKTITNASTTILATAAVNGRRRISVDNESTTATIACSFIGAAAINTAGSYTIPPGNTRTWNTSPVPSEAMTCISSAATSPATVEAN